MWWNGELQPVWRIVPKPGTTTAGQPSRTGATTGPKCFRCGELGHQIADCCKGEKYGKGLLVDSGGAFEEQGDGEEQEAAFDEDGEAEEEFLSGEAESGTMFMVRGVYFTPRKAKMGTSSTTICFTHNV